MDMYCVLLVSMCLVILSHFHSLFFFKYIFLLQSNFFFFELHPKIVILLSNNSFFMSFDHSIYSYFNYPQYINTFVFHNVYFSGKFLKIPYTICLKSIILINDLWLIDWHISNCENLKPGVKTKRYFDQF